MVCVRVRSKHCNCSCPSSQTLHCNWNVLWRKIIDKPWRISTLFPWFPFSTAPVHTAFAAAHSLLFRDSCQAWRFSKRSLHSTWVGVFVDVLALRLVRAAAALCGPLLLRPAQGPALVAVPSEQPRGSVLPMTSLWPLLTAWVSCFSTYLFIASMTHWIPVSVCDTTLLSSYLCQHVAHGSQAIDKGVPVHLWFHIYPRQQFGTAVSMLSEFFCPPEKWNPHHIVPYVHDVVIPLYNHQHSYLPVPCPWPQRASEGCKRMWEIQSEA